MLEEARKMVSTHSRLKAAGIGALKMCEDLKVSTHSRLKAAGLNIPFKINGYNVSTHSRLKAAGAHSNTSCPRSRRFNTQPPEGGWTN